MSDSALRKATLSRELKFARSHVVASTISASNNLEFSETGGTASCTVAQDTKVIQALTRVSESR